jgi:hypothetical protein
MPLEAVRSHAGVALWPAGEQALANTQRMIDIARQFEPSAGGPVCGDEKIDGWLPVLDPVLYLSPGSGTCSPARAARNSVQIRCSIAARENPRWRSNAARSAPVGFRRAGHSVVGPVLFDARGSESTPLRPQQILQAGPPVLYRTSTRPERSPYVGSPQGRKASVGMGPLLQASLGNAYNGKVGAATRWLGIRKDDAREPL